MNHETFDRIKTAGDIAAAGLTGGVIVGLFSPAAALLTIIWTGCRLWEMVTGRPFSECRLARCITKILHH